MSTREDQFLRIWERWGPTGFHLVTQHVFAPPRRWRFDFVFIAEKVAIEVEGLVWYGARKSRHQTAAGAEGDMEKYRAAVETGWRLLRFSQRDLDRRPLDVVEQIERVLSQPPRF